MYINIYTYIFTYINIYIYIYIFYIYTLAESHPYVQGFQLAPAEGIFFQHGQFLIFSTRYLTIFLSWMKKIGEPMTSFI